MEPDYPAAHSMDTTFFAVDADGRVAIFTTGENGHVPITASGRNAGVPAAFGGGHVGCGPASSSSTASPWLVVGSE